MQRLSALGKPYKYVVTCVIMQKTGETSLADMRRHSTTSVGIHGGVAAGTQAVPLAWHMHGTPGWQL